MKPPFGGMLNDWGAAVSTANATWWMLLVTLLSAGAAVLVVWSAFQVQRLQFLEERRKEEDRKTALNNDAITAVMETSIFVKALQEKFAFERVEREVWNDISRCNEHRLVLQHFLTSDLTLLSNRYWLSAVH